MSKKKKNYRNLLSRILLISDYLISSNSKYIIETTEFFFQNIFRLSTSFKQLFFSLFNLSFEFVKLFSTGVILKKHTNFFKFFKKSIFNINPLVMVIRYSFVDFFKRLYILECLNYSKKQFLFLKKFLNSVNITIKYMLFKKTWEYTTKPVKRIKRRVCKMLQNL